MKQLILGVSILFFLVSCDQKTNLATNKEQLKEITKPNKKTTNFTEKHKAKAMVLGVFHFSNPGLDGYKSKFYFNILEKERQTELDTLLSRIAAYKPTKILVEWNRIKWDSITKVYFKNYLNGTFKIDDKRDEVYQIGFKLAKKLGHNQIFCSDATADWFGVELDWDNYDESTYLKSHGQFEKTTRHEYDSFYKHYDSLKTVQTLTEHFVAINSPSNRLKDHQAYLTSTILEGAGDHYLGADSVGKWYRRNLRIFANAYDLTDFNKEERLLLIYGSGHVWQLRQFFTDSPDYEYIEPNKYLDK